MCREPDRDNRSAVLEAAPEAWNLILTTKTMRNKIADGLFHDEKEPKTTKRTL